LDHGGNVASSEFDPRGPEDELKAAWWPERFSLIPAIRRHEEDEYHPLNATWICSTTARYASCVVLAILRQQFVTVKTAQNRSVILTKRRCLSKKT